jgi:hypothetical protein
MAQDTCDHLVTYTNRVEPVEARSLRVFVCDTEDGFAIQMPSVFLEFENIGGCMLNVRRLAGFRPAFFLYVLNA